MLSKKKLAKVKPNKALKKINKTQPQCDTTRIKYTPTYQYRDNLKVEKTLQKNKEVKESDVFEGLPQKNKSQSKK
jgi:hypothetical protein